MVKQRKTLYLLPLLLVLAFSVVACTPQQQKQAVDTLTEDSDTTIAVPALGVDSNQVDEMMVNDNGADKMPPAEISNQEDDIVAAPQDESVIFSGPVLAGSSSPLLEFNQAD